MEGTTRLVLAILGGMLPAIMWLFFWLREDKEHPEPKGLILITFILGMITVIFVLPFEQLAKTKILNEHVLTVVWAFTEEMIKYLACALVAFRTREITEPIDYPIFLIVAALGFAALENTLFLFPSLQMGDSVVSLLTGNLRFLGATLLHAVSSSLIGIALGLAFFSSWLTKKFALIVGIIAATALHSVFNFFIIKSDGQNFFSVFGFLWIVTIISMLLFEKLRRMSQIIDA